MLLIFIFHLKAVEDDRPSKDALQSDQVISRMANKKSLHIPGEQVISGLQIDDAKTIEIIEEAREAFWGTTKPPEVKEEVKEETYVDEEVFIQENKVIVPPVKKITQKLSNINIFKLKNKVEKDQHISLPSGSSALATLLGGIEVAQEKRQIDARVDFAFLGPNKTFVELTGCIVWLEVGGNYNTERIYGKGYSLSCRSANGTTFEVPIKAHIKDKSDEFLGMKGELITRGKVAAAALSFLRDGIQEFGKAISAAQVVTEISQGNQISPGMKGENIFGDKSKYIAGQSVAGATGKFLNWWVDYYTGLEPTLAVPPGHKLFLTIEGEVQVPKIFFKPTSKKENNNVANTLDSISKLMREPSQRRVDFE